MGYNYYSTYPSTTYSTSSTGDLTAALAALGAFAAVFIIFAIALAILTIIGQWKMFKKAGVEGYISLIPIYNTVTEMKLGGLPIYWFFLTYCAVIPLIGWIGPVVLVFWKNIRYFFVLHYAKFASRNDIKKKLSSRGAERRG